MKKKTLLQEVKKLLRYTIWEWFESPGRYAKTDDAAMTVATQGNKIRKTFGRSKVHNITFSIILYILMDPKKI